MWSSTAFRRTCLGFSAKGLNLVPATSTSLRHQIQARFLRTGQPLFRFGKSSSSPSETLGSRARKIKAKIEESSPVKLQKKESEGWSSNHGGGEQERMTGLLKPTLFAASFVGLAFTGSAIWQYENIRSIAVERWKRTHKKAVQKYGEFRRDMNHIWSHLDDASKLFVPILAANGAVFLMWKIPRLAPFMMKHFVSDPAAKNVCLPMINSVFSHVNWWHFFVNMYCLHSFLGPCVETLGKEQFLAVYLSGGIVASLGSIVHKVLTQRPGASLGASGAIMTVLGMCCTIYPDKQLQIIFLPWYPFSADSGMKGIMAIDALGILLGWRFFDHAAHLAGILFGILYVKYGQELLWSNRGTVMRAWDSIRGGMNDE